MQKSVLVTGGSGFIGSWVLRELCQRDARVVVLDRLPGTDRWQRLLGTQASEIIYTDTSLTDRDAIRSTIETHEISHVVHLAALLTPDCQNDPFLGCQVNVLGSSAVFDAARLAGGVKSLSYASSYAVYGPEEHAASNRPPLFYGAFKQAVDAIAEQYWIHHRLPSFAIRPHVVYGPERNQGLTAGPSLACRAAAVGESYAIEYSGPAGYDYVEDVALAFVRGAFECPNGATVCELPSEQAVPEDFVQLIEMHRPESLGKITANGPPIPLNRSPNPCCIRELFPDWKATSLPTGIQKTIEYYLEHHSS